MTGPYAQTGAAVRLIGAKPQVESDLEREIGALFEAHWLPVCRYLTRILHDTGEAEDAAQEAFVRMYEERLRGNAIAEPRAWLFRAAHNCAVDRLRRPSHEGVESDTAVDAGIEAALIMKDRDERMRLGLRLLSDQERHCLELRAEGLRYREIAGVLGIKGPTVAKFLDRAIGKLRRVLG